MAFALVVLPIDQLCRQVASGSLTGTACKRSTSKSLPPASARSQLAAVTAAGFQVRPAEASHRWCAAADVQRMTGICYRDTRYSRRFGWMAPCPESSSRTAVARSFSRLWMIALDGQLRRTTISEPRINDRIRVPEVRLVGPNGEQVGIVRVEDALRLAAESDLDLVEVAPMAKPPVAKLMDFGKFKYEAAIKEREARKNQVNTVIKEIKFRPKIDPHDYATKKGHVERFLKAGDKVKVTIMFRGREQSRPELGYRLLQRLAGDIGELGFVESTPKQDGRNMIMVIGPTKKKAEAKAEQRRKREEDAAVTAASNGRPAEAVVDASVADTSVQAETAVAE
jgi:translation initiation factor IF-3